MLRAFLLVDRADLLGTNIDGFRVSSSSAKIELRVDVA